MKVTVAPAPMTKRPAKSIADVSAAAIASVPSPITALPAATTRRAPSASMRSPARQHEAGVAVEVGGGEEPHQSAGGAERLHEVLRDHAGRDAMDEGEQEEKGRDTPHQPPPPGRRRRAGSAGPEPFPVAVADHRQLVGGGRGGLAHSRAPRGDPSRWPARTVSTLCPDDRTPGPSPRSPDRSGIPQAW
jgi:hypothetical protein